MVDSNHAEFASQGRENEARRGRGCVFWGCSTVALVLVIAGGAIGWTVWSIYGELKESTSTERVPVADFAPAPGQVKEVAARAETFAKKARGAEGRLELSAEDLNALLRAGDGRFAEAVHVRKLEADRAHVELSLPLDELQGFEGRFFNGEAVLGVHEEHRELAIVIHELRTRDGKELSARLRSVVAGFVRLALDSALAAERARDPGAGASPTDPAGSDLRRVFAERGEFRIEDGRLIVEVAAPEHEGEPEPTP